MAGVRLRPIADRLDAEATNRQLEQRKKKR